MRTSVRSGPRPAGNLVTAIVAVAAIALIVVLGQRYLPATVGGSLTIPRQVMWIPVVWAGILAARYTIGALGSAASGRGRRAGG